METLTKERLRVPRKAALVQKVDDINRFLEPVWTEPVLAEKFAKARAMAKRVDPANAAKVKKEGIRDRKAKAEEAGDEEEAARCDAELAALENNAATNGTVSKPIIRSSPAKATTATQQDKLALVNQKNRGKNSEDVRKALLEERRKQLRERERAIVEAKAKHAAEDEARRKKQQVELLGVPGKDSADMRELFGDLSDMSRAGTPMSGVSTPKMRRSRQGTPMNGVPKEKSKLGMAATSSQHGADDELGGLDLGIDVEI
jgi:RNA polymerase-associated protein RTF1